MEFVKTNEWYRYIGDPHVSMLANGCTVSVHLQQFNYQ